MTFIHFNEESDYRHFEKTNELSVVMVNNQTENDHRL